MAPVYLFVYDLSNKSAAIISSAVFGTPIKAIWHTSIVVYGREIDFGPRGIENRDVKAERNIIVIGNADPVEVYMLGNTDYSYKTLKGYIEFLNCTLFKPGSYNVLTHNCNVFSNKLSNELVKISIPQHILDLPADICCIVLRKLFEVSANTYLNSTNKNGNTDNLLNVGYVLLKGILDSKPINRFNLSD